MRTLGRLPLHLPRPLLVRPRGGPETLVGGTLVQPEAHPEPWELPFLMRRLEVDTNDSFGSWSDSRRCPTWPCPPLPAYLGRPLLPAVP